MKAKTLPYLFTAAILVLSLNFQACKKPGDTIGIVTVTDGNGNLVSGANVKLLGVDTQGNPGGRIDVNETTGSDGKATFNFNEYYKRGEAGFTVLDVIATKDTLAGKTIIKIEEEKTSDCIVKIEPQ
jgi:hypothetical protein